MAAGVALPHEQLRRDREVARVGEAARDIGDVLVNAEDLADDQNHRSLGLALRRGAIDRQLDVADPDQLLSGDQTGAVGLDGGLRHHRPTATAKPVPSEVRTTSRRLTSVSGVRSGTTVANSSFSILGSLQWGNRARDCRNRDRGGRYHHRMQTPVSPGAPLAAVDIGSNSFRLEIGQLPGGLHGRYRRIDYLKDTVRLGAGLDANGMLSEEAAQRGLACLRRFASRLAGFVPGQVRAVATQTLREAQNRNAFLLRAQEALGFPIEVISGREEARLIYAGVAHMQPSQIPRLVVDIGGRSTELILGRARQPQVAESFRVGCVSLSLRYFGDGRITDAAFRAAQVAAGAELEEALQPFAPVHWQEALGASGSVGAVSQILQAAGVTDGRITPAGLRWCIERAIDCGHIDRLDLPGLRPDRRPVLPGGLAILYTLAANFDIGVLQPARGALRQGVIVDLHERLDVLRHARPGDMRDESVAELQRRFAVDTAQADRVAGVALALFDAAMPDAEPEVRRELAWACALHEIGLMVSHHDHHRHSAYLLAHVDAPGFSQSQQRRIGELVLGQRGGLRKVEPQLASETFAWQILCLRLAVIKCHAREAINLQALKLRARGRDAQLSYPRGWTQSRPRTLFLLHEEATTWERSGPLRLRVPAA
jgi:exopolyphosphatase/guanosine-5'-triphosphate,3'-diphosphate pyrophosphatase